MKKATHAVFWIGTILLGWAIRWYFSYLEIAEPDWDYWIESHLFSPERLFGIAISFLPGLLLTSLFVWPSRHDIAARVSSLKARRTFTPLLLLAFVTSDTVQHGFQVHSAWGAFFWFLAVFGNWIVVGAVFALFAGNPKSGAT